MNQDKVVELMKKYAIDSVEDLGYILKGYQESLDNNSGDEDSEDVVPPNYFTEKVLFKVDIPEARKILEIYKLMFKNDSSYNYNDIKSINSFSKYLYKNKVGIQIAEDSLYKHLNGVYCNKVFLKDGDFKEQMTLPGPIAYDFCNKLNKRFSYEVLFENNYTSIAEFRKNIMIFDVYKTMLITEKEASLNKREKESFFDFVNTSTKELSKNINGVNLKDKSEEFLINLADVAFNRKLDSDSLKIIKLFKQKNSNNYKDICLQIEAKILSSEEKDQEAIEKLRELELIKGDKIDTETKNLLAASIKRLAIKEYKKKKIEKETKRKNFIEIRNTLKKDGRSKIDEDLKKIDKDLIDIEIALNTGLNESRNLYEKVFNFNNDYYPALNHIYLSLIIERSNKLNFKKTQERAKERWPIKNVSLKEDNWWKFISHIEFLVLIENFDEAKNLINEKIRNDNLSNISKFQLGSTIRQLILYKEFCPSKELDDFINEVKLIEQDIEKLDLYKQAK